MATEQTDIGENEVDQETGRMITTKSLLDRVSEIFFILNYEATTCSRKSRSNSPFRGKCKISFKFTCPNCFINNYCAF